MLKCNGGGNYTINLGYIITNFYKNIDSEFPES